MAEGRTISKNFFQEVCISLYSGTEESHQSYLHMVEPEKKGKGVGGVSVADFYRSHGYIHFWLTDALLCRIFDVVCAYSSKCVIGEESFVPIVVIFRFTIFFGGSESQEFVWDRQWQLGIRWHSGVSSFHLPCLDNLLWDWIYASWSFSSTRFLLGTCPTYLGGSDG